MPLRSRSLLLVALTAALVAALVMVWLAEPREPTQLADAVPSTAPAPQPESMRHLAITEEVERTQVDAPEVAVAEEQPEVLAEGPLDGLVVDFLGAPLAGVRVALECDEGVQLERTSDAEGRFSIESLPWSESWRVSAELAPSWRLWRMEGFHPTPGGGWHPALIRMIGVAALEVRVEDAQGRPLQGIAVAVQPDSKVPLAVAQTSAEPRDTSLGAARMEDPLPRERGSEVTGPDGVARFTDVWAQQRLIVSLVIGKRRRWAVRHVQGLAVLENEDPLGEVISIPVGGELALRAQPVELRRRLSGRVSFADGRPVVRPSIYLRSLDSGSDAVFRDQARGAEDGSYSVVLDDLREGATLRVRATDGAGSDQHQGKHSGGVELAVAGADLRADVVVAPMLTIAGRIERGGEPPNPGTLRILPEEPAHPAAPDDIGYQPVTPAGTFEVRSLAPGPYVLEFSERWFLAVERHTFPNVRAGTTDFVWSLPEQSGVRIELGFRAPRPVASFNLLVAQPQRVPGPGVAWPAALPSSVVSSYGWPAWRGTKRSSGGGSMTIGATTFDYRLQSFKAIGGQPDEVLDLPVDVYALGALAWDAEGRAFAPVMSDPARFASGAYEVHFELVDTAAIVGRVAGAHPDLGLEVAVLDANGRRISLVQDRRGPNLPLAPDGHFRLDSLPAGIVLLRVGTPADLERGLFGAEQKLELAPGQTADVTLRW
jgi:hypothetical protein